MYIPLCPYCGNEEITESVFGFYCSECDRDFDESDLHPDDDYFQFNPSPKTIDPLEEKIWDAITESAKSKFNYQEFSNGFPPYFEDNIKDNIIWEIIMRYAGGQEQLEICSYLNSQIMLIGLQIPIDDLKKFVASCKKDFGVEIFVTQFATKALNDGLLAKSVLGSVYQLLSNRGN